MKKLVVVGSINIDIVSTVQNYPRPGETIKGESFGTFPGGKGANQAAAAGKLGADVVLLGKVGNDVFGQQAIKALESASVDTSRIEVCEGVNTGVASIWVNGKGENSIVIQEGANGQVDVDYIQKHIRAFDDCYMVLLQLEIPMNTVEWVAKYCAAKGIQVMFDPAPAARCSRELLATVDYITPNEGEMVVVSGQVEASRGARELLENGVKHVVLKAGDDGSYLMDNNGSIHVEGFKVDAVDTTAAGDSFNAGLAVALANGMDSVAALTYANAVGALAVTGIGAQSSMPTKEEVDMLIKRQNGKEIKN